MTPPRWPAVAISLAFVLAACNSAQSSSSPGGVGAAPSTGSGDASASADAAAASSASGATTSGAAGGSASPGDSGSVATAQTGQTQGDLQSTFESTVERVSPSVVVIETDSGLGSGVVLDDSGDIVTNAHVAESAKTFRVTTATGTRLDATLVGSFVPDDVAVIKASDGHLQPAAFGDSSKLRVGQIVLAIGNPLGLASSVTDGIVSALGRNVSEPNGPALPGLIQTSAPINPGNSGGALVDLTGTVIGIPTLAATDPELGGSAPGIGFAIPSNIATDIAHQLIANGKVVASHRAYLGIRTANVTGANGVLIYSVEPGGPAAKAGLKENVLITSVAGKPTPDSETLASVLAGLEPGQTVDVETMSQDGATKTVKVTLGELPG